MHSYPAKIFESQPNIIPAAISGEGFAIQRELAIGVINNSEEAEADTMAERGMRMPEAPLLQEDERLQRRTLYPVIQAKGESTDNTVNNI
ncbi:MAG: hypothetical protein WAW41_13250, partial [Methylobacter sp.]